MAATGVGLALALFGPAIVALLWKWLGPEPPSWTADAAGLAGFLALIATVAAIASFAQKLSWAEVGFRTTSWASIPRGIALAACLIYIFGPLAARALQQAGLSFDTGKRAFATLPTWYLVPAIAAIAAGEEWLYRGYAIERLQALTGNTWLSALLPLLAFGLAHVPLWGIGVSLTTLVSGGILTALYLWRRDIAFLMLAHVLTDLYGFLIASR